MTCYAVIDTNVLVSSLLSSHSDAATVQVVGKLFSGAFVPLYSEEIMAEYDNVLHRKKFHFSESSILTLLHAIEELGLPVVPVPTGEKLPDQKDLPFYEVVSSEQDKEAYLVTGNGSHFPNQPFVVTAREFLDILNNIAEGRSET